MAVNKIICNSSVLIDLTSDTVGPQQLREGYTAHDKTGAIITGTAKSFPLTPIVYDYNIGYINAATWIYENPTNTYTDIYEAKANCTYVVALGSTVGTRFRSIFTTTDITGVTSGNVAGTQIVNKNNPPAYDAVVYKSGSSDGYILVAKDNIGHSGLISYVFNITEAFD